MICELYPKANDLQFSMLKMPNELQESEASNKIYGCSTPSNGCIKYTIMQMCQVRCLGFLSTTTSGLAVRAATTCKIRVSVIIFFSPICKISMRIDRVCIDYHARDNLAASIGNTPFSPANVTHLVYRDKKTYFCMETKSWHLNVNEYARSSSYSTVSSFLSPGRRSHLTAKASCSTVTMSNPVQLEIVIWARRVFRKTG